MEWLRKWVIRIVAAVPILGVAVWLSLAPGNQRLFPATANERPVWVIDHGWHTGLVIGQAELRTVAWALAARDQEASKRLLWLTNRFPAAEWIEIGWGDSDFYQATPALEDIDPWLAAKALLWPTDAALQVVPGWGDPGLMFANSDQVRLPLSPDGFERLAQALAASVPGEASNAPLGASLYGGGAFFESAKDYHLFRTCNHWTAALLRAAGVPSSAVPGTLSSTLMAELKIRALGYIKTP